MRIMLPEIDVRCESDEAMRERDRLMMEKMKMHADNRSHARPSDTEPGDVVLVKQQKRNKLSTPFSPPTLSGRAKERYDGHSPQR